MPPYVKESLNAPLSNKDVLLKAVQDIQEMLPEGYRITIDFYRIDAQDGDDDAPKIINGDSINEIGEIDFELFTALEQLSVIEDALPFLRGLTDSGRRDEIIHKLFADDTHRSF